MTHPADRKIVEECTCRLAVERIKDAAWRHPKDKDKQRRECESAVLHVLHALGAGDVANAWIEAAPELGRTK